MAVSQVFSFSIFLMTLAVLVRGETTDEYAKDQKDFQYDYYDDIIFPAKMGKENIRASSEGPVDLCNLAQPTPMICKCDEEVIDVACFIMTQIAKNDLVWDLFGDKKSLVKLRLNSRPEGSLTFVPSYAFDHLHNLQTLGFAHGKLGKVHSYAFARLSRLSTIDVTNNGIDFLDENSFAHLHNLVDLALSENFLIHLRVRTFVDLPRLRIIYLDRNNISRIDDGVFDDMPDLTELELWGNSLTMLTPDTFRGLRKLHHLDLSYNRLEVLEEGTFKHAPRLVEINLQHNFIEEIQQGAFEGLSHLMRLRLSNNKLTTLPAHPSPFVHLNRLLLLDLTNNKMKTLPSNVIMSLPNVYNTSAYFHITGNPFHCGCSIYWMVTLMSSSYPTPLREELSTIKCRLPTSSRSFEDKSAEDYEDKENEKHRRLLLHVPWEDMGCVPTTTTTTTTTTTKSTPYKYDVPAAAAFSPTTSSSAGSYRKQIEIKSATSIPSKPTNSSPKGGPNEVNDESKTDVPPITLTNSSAAKLTVPPFIVANLLLLLLLVTHTIV